MEKELPVDEVPNYNLEFADQVNGFLEPEEITYDELISRFPKIEGANKGNHVDSRGIPTTGIGLTAHGVNDIAETLGFPKWAPPSGKLREGSHYSAKDLGIPWTQEQQRDIARVKLTKAAERLERKGVRLGLIPKSFRMAVLDLIYNAQDAAFAYKGKETKFIQKLRTFSNKTSLQRTPTEAFSVVRETLDIIKSEGRYAAGLAKRRARWANEIAKVYGMPKIQRIEFDRNTNAVVYTFDGNIPGEKTNKLRLGQMSGDYDVYHLDDDFQNKREVRSQK